jgi:hypothetical protein
MTDLMVRVCVLCRMVFLISSDLCLWLQWCSYIKMVPCLSVFSDEQMMLLHDTIGRSLITWKVLSVKPFFASYYNNRCQWCHPSLIHILLSHNTSLCHTLQFTVCYFKINVLYFILWGFQSAQIVSTDFPFQVLKKVRKWSYPCNRLRRPIGLWDVEDPTLSRQSAHRWQ